MTPEQKQTANVVFFDIGATLGSVSVSDQTLTLEVFPGVNEVLIKLHKKSVRLGIVSRIGDFTPAMVDHMLQDCDLSKFFDTGLRHYIKGNTPKDKSEFKKALGKAGITKSGSAIFIGEDPEEREQAALAGMRIGAKPKDALGMLDIPVSIDNH